MGKLRNLMRLAKDSAAMKHDRNLPVTLEPLEPRLLLAGADWLAAAVASDHVMDVAPLDHCMTDGAIAAAGDDQVYRFTSGARGTITIQVGGDDGVFDPFLQVYNSAGRLIRQNDNARRGATDSATAFRTLANKTYYIRVTGAKGSAGQYSVAVISKPVDDYGNTPATAKTLPQSRRSGIWTTVGSINYPGDVDVRAFVAAKTGNMQIVESRRIAKQPLYCDLSVYDAQGNLLAHAGSAGEARATVNLAVVAGETYYFYAAGADGTMGLYVIRALTLPPSPVPPQGETPANGSTSPDAFAASAQITTTTVIQPSGLQLVVLGTDAADVVALSQTDAGLVLVTSRGTTNIAGAYASAAIYGFGGDDTLKVTNAVTVSVTIVGGNGNDTIFNAGRGRDTVYGGSGDDLIVTVGGGADTVYGGDGFDSLWMDTQDTLADASATETAGGAVHRIGQFFQPTQNPAQAVPLEIAGQSLVEPATSYPYQDFSSRPLFAGTPNYSDARQGYLGDCYFIASLASVADKDPRVIQQMIAPMGDGTFAVRFYRGAQAVYVRVDGKLPSYGGTPIYAGLGPGGQTWVALAEKAYAQFRCNQNSYVSLEGGWMGDVYRELTGAAVTDLWFNYTTPGIGTTLASYLAAGHAVTAATKGPANVPFVGNHAYMVKSIETVGSETWVTVYNPWGVDGRSCVDGRSWDTNPGDGLLRVTLGEFRSSFIGASVSMV